MFVGNRMRLGPTINQYTSLYLGRDDPTGGLDIVGFMGDDHRPRTVDWDLEISKAAHVANNKCVLYGNDLIQGANLPTAVAMTTDIIKALGYFCPPGLMHLYLDDAWREIGREVGKLLYMPQVIIEHCHPIAKKGVEWDDGYREVNSGQQYESDGNAYRAWLESGNESGGWRDRLKSLG